MLTLILLIMNLEIFQPKIQKNQNKEDVNNIRAPKKNKDFSQTNNIKKNMENNEEIVKSKDSNIVNQSNKKENLNKKKSIEINTINEKNNEKKEEENSFENKNLKEIKKFLPFNFKKEIRKII